MGFFDWFVGRHTKYVEDQVLHEREVNRLDRESNALMIEALKKTHTEELVRVIEENQRLRNENERFRLYLSPGGRTEQPEPAASTKESMQSVAEVLVAGTPWQRILARGIREQEEAAARKITAPVEPVNEPAPATAPATN